MKTSYPIKGGPRRSRVHVNAPQKFFGLWRLRVVWPGEPDVHTTATVKCGNDGRLKVHWKKNLGEALNALLAYTVDRRVAELTGGGRICDVGAPKTRRGAKTSTSRRARKKKAASGSSNREALVRRGLVRKYG